MTDPTRSTDVWSAGHRLAAVVARFLDSDLTVKDLREALAAYNATLEQAARNVERGL